MQEERSNATRTDFWCPLFRMPIIGAMNVIEFGSTQCKGKASFLKENILPLQESGQLNFIDADEGELLNTPVLMSEVHGHTESQMLP